MTRAEQLFASAVCALGFSCFPAWALDVPAGTLIEIRLTTKVSSQNAKPKDPVEAVVIAPVLADGQFAIPAGAKVRGAVETVTASGKPDERSTLVLRFTEIEVGGATLEMATQLAGIDNAREKVDEQGQINGILASETITGKLDTELHKLAGKYSGLADVLSTVKNAVLQAPDNDITYEAGVEMELRLAAPLHLKEAAGPGPAAQLQSIPNEAALLALVAREPFQTRAQNPPKPSDITNLMIVGEEDAVWQAFADAGWASASRLNGLAKFETVRAVVENRGYKEAPVSVLLLDGKPPDRVYEKMNNTFARRHHLRVWRRPETFLGKPVWAVAATHDTGINFSQQDLTFIHRIDSEIDRERAKVVNDLIFTGRVQGVALVDRPKVPQHAQNATGDNLETDGKIAVLLLH